MESTLDANGKRHGLRSLDLCRTLYFVSRLITVFKY